MRKIFSRIHQTFTETNKELSFVQEITICMGSTSLTSEDDSLESVVKVPTKHCIKQRMRVAVG